MQRKTHFIPEGLNRLYEGENGGQIRKKKKKKRKREEKRKEGKEGGASGKRSRILEAVLHRGATMSGGKLDPMTWRGRRRIMREYGLSCDSSRRTISDNFQRASLRRASTSLSRYINTSSLRSFILFSKQRRDSA